MAHDLVAEYTPLVRRIAARLWRRTAGIVQLDDLVAAGMQGLWEVVTRNQVVHKGHVILRVRGAILDELRRNDWLGRAERRRARAEGNTGRAVVGFDDVSPVFDQVVPGSTRDLVVKLDVARALTVLDSRELEIVVALMDGQGQDEIAEQLGVSAPRVSQLKTRALNKLREFLAA